MLQVLIFIYALTWLFTYGARWESRAMFWFLWCSDVAVLFLGEGAPVPLGIHFLMAIVGMLSPVFLAQCTMTPFKD
jgi:hypothetical protein